MRVCTKCRLPKSEDQFSWSNTRLRRAATCHLCHREYNNRRNRFNRMLVLKHYGGDPPRCWCCGQTFLEFLSLDHIAGGGRKHRQEIKIRWWEWIIKNNFPPEFRVACHNCNQAIGIYGYCPHQVGSKLEVAMRAYDPLAPSKSYKLTISDVERIKELLASGEAQSQIAAGFNVSRSTICLINGGKRWAT